MTFKKIMPFTLFLLAFPAMGGGISGGGGVAALNDMVLEVMSAPLDQPDLGLEKLSIPATDFRRARVRLSIADETTVIYKGEPLVVTRHAGGIIDTTGERQVMPEL